MHARVFARHFFCNTEGVVPLQWREAAHFALALVLANKFAFLA